ncbi:MAG: sugar phosphate isomerase/epimerase [Phycisphaerales bacterium]
MRIAFSTLACPDWPIERVARLAGELAYDGVELRTLGFGDGPLVCDPALSDPMKVRGLLAEHGVAPLCLATSLKFDRCVFPPIIGRAITDQEREARRATRLIALGRAMDCPELRVFAFEAQGRESRASAVRRILWRLGMAVDAARNTGVRVLLENGGSFAAGADLADFLDEIRVGWFGACYSVATACHAGEDPVAALDRLGDRVGVVRLKAHQGGKPCLLADADDPNEEVVRALAARRFRGTIVVEHDLLWQDERARASIPTAEDALRHAIETIYSWMSRSAHRSASGSGHGSGHAATSGVAVGV